MVADEAITHTERIFTENGIRPFHLALEKTLADHAGTTDSRRIPSAEYTQNSTFITLLLCAAVTLALLFSVFDLFIGFFFLWRFGRCFFSFFFAVLAFAHDVTPYDPGLCCLFTIDTTFFCILYHSLEPKWLFSRNRVQAAAAKGRLPGGRIQERLQEFFIDAPLPGGQQIDVPFVIE